MMISVWVAAAWAVAAALTAGVIVWLAQPEAEQPRRRERRAEYEHPDFADAAGFAVTADNRGHVDDRTAALAHHDRRAGVDKVESQF